MMAKSPKQHLAGCVEQLEKSARRLRASFSLCSSFDFDAPDDETFDALEILTARFSRTSDILIQKVFRALDAYDLYESGTPLDVINRADKRELFDDVYSIRKIRELRNRIAHEYELEDIAPLMGEIMRLTPILLDTCSRTAQYALNIIRS